MPTPDQTPTPLDIPVAGTLERLLSHPGFQRVSALLLSSIGVACAVGIVVALVGGASLPRLISAAALAMAMEWLLLAMQVALVLVGGALGLYLSIRGHRRALTRLLALSCAAISAGLGLFFLVRVTAPVAMKSMRENHVEAFFALVLLLAILFMSLWMFATAKFFLFFPKPVKILDLDPAAHYARGWHRPKTKAGWRWLGSSQFIALAVGIALIMVLDVQADRLPSERWSDAMTYFVCWMPFAAISAKQDRLNDDDRRSIRWVVLGQAIWLVLFLGGIVFLYALRASGVLAFPNWNDSEQFTRAFVGFFYAGFVIVLMLTLAFSILYHGTLDPDLMIRRTWSLAAFGLVSGVLFVVIERVVAGVVASGLDISAVDALTIVTVITATLILPLRSWLERAIKSLLERWNSSHAIADGVRREAVIVFADLTGYTALTERNEREALIMAAIFHRDAQELAKKHRGVLIKTMGDAVMLRFAEVDEAFRALSELKRVFRVHVEMMSMAPLLIHAAIHRGEVVEAPSGDVFGATVNLAARLLGAAGADDIIASHAALERSGLAAQAQSLGEKTFKNVEMPVSCFRLA